jgi:hypothetical protein
MSSTNLARVYECGLAILPPFNGHFPLWRQK